MPKPCTCDGECRGADRLGQLWYCRKSQFPVLLSRKDIADGCPVAVPLALVVAHGTQAWANHGQTVWRLAERGGLSPVELHAVLEDREYPWRRKLEDIGPPAIEFLKAIRGAKLPTGEGRD